MLSLLHTCTTKRQSAIGTNGRKEYVANLTGVSCLFLSMSAQSAIAIGYSVGKAWDVYFNDGTDVQVNDKLTYNGEDYIVKGRQVFSGLPVVSHIRIAAVTENAHA